MQPVRGSQLPAKEIGLGLFGYGAGGGAPAYRLPEGAKETQVIKTRTDTPHRLYHVCRISTNPTRPRKKT